MGSYSVCHNLTIGKDVHTSHYEITGLHPVIPSRSEGFRQILDPLPTVDTPLDTTAKYKYVKRSEADSDVILVKSVPQDPNQVRTCLQATVFPQKAKRAFEKVQQDCSYTCNIRKQTVPPTQKLAELVVGKTGLVKYLMSDDEDEHQSYEYNIVKESQQHNHQCNIDIAALYVKDHLQQPACSIKEAFAKVGQALKINWCGPPKAIDGRKGKVVYIVNGAVYKLSNKLIKFNDPPQQPNEYPAYVWHLNPAHNVTVPSGHSGAPVFLVSRDNTTYYLLGNLITAKSASPVMFSLDMVRDDIAIHHIDQILNQMLPYLPRQLDDTAIKQLKQYKEYLKWHSKEQSLTPLMEEGYIRSELSICVHPHQNHDHCYYYCTVRPNKI